MRKWRNSSEARASGSYPAGHRFKSHFRHHNRPVGQAVKTRPFHGCNMGSIPVRVTSKTKALHLECFFRFVVIPYAHRPIFKMQSHFESGSWFKTNCFVSKRQKLGFFPYGSPNVTNPNYFVNRNWFGFVFYYNYLS